MYSTATETLRLLEQRLARLEFYLGRDEAEGDASTEQQNSARLRLEKLETRFSKLCAEHTLLTELLQLQTRFPELFADPAQDSNDGNPSTSNEQQIVLSSAETITSTAAGLNTLQEYPVPDVKAIVSLVMLRSRLDRALERKKIQWQQVMELRQRSASLLTQWYQTRILEEGEYWADCEERLRRVEQVLQREQNAAETEKAEV